MFGELGNQVVPLSPILRWRDVRLVPKCLDDLFRRKFLGHETQFDEGPDTIGQEAIVNLVHVGKVVDRLARIVLVVDSDFVVEDGMKANILESRDELYLEEVFPVTLAKRKNGAPGAEHLLPEVRKWVNRGGCIHNNDFSGIGLAGLRPTGRRQQQDEYYSS